MHIFVVMIEMYMLCVSSDISHHILYVVLYHVGLFSLLEFEINYLSIYLIMHKEPMHHAGAIRQLLYDCAYVREIIHSLKLVDYPPVHTHKNHTITYSCIMTLPPLL